MTMNNEEKDTKQQMMSDEYGREFRRMPVAIYRHSDRLGRCRLPDHVHLTEKQT